MFRQSKTTALKTKAASGKDLAVALAQDKKFRKQLLSAIRHGEFARRRAARQIAPVAVVQQLDDSRLHWVASVGGWKAEWNAKILEQHPDRQISWISEDGKKTRGTVTFEERSPSRTLIRLSMSYAAEGPMEAVGSTA